MREGFSGELEAKWPCPKCRKVLDGATAIDNDGSPPKAGDYSVCAYCLTLLRYGTDSFRVLTRTELGAMPRRDRKKLLLAQQVAKRVLTKFYQRN